MLNNHQEELPSKNNFYASLEGVSKTRVKEVLERNGWGCRKASWTDFEFANDWSELILEGDEDNSLLNGAVIFSEAYIKVLDKLFKTLGGLFQYEFYDENQNMIFENRTDS